MIYRNSLVLLRMQYPIGLSQFICLSCSGVSVFIDDIESIQEVSQMSLQQWSVVGVLQGQVHVWSDKLRHDRLIFPLNVSLYQDFSNTTFWRLYLMPLQSLSSSPSRRVGDVYWIVPIALSRWRGGEWENGFCDASEIQIVPAPFLCPACWAKDCICVCCSNMLSSAVLSPVTIFSLSPVPFKSVIATQNFPSSKEVSLASGFLGEKGK